MSIYIAASRADGIQPKVDDALFYIGHVPAFKGKVINGLTESIHREDGVIKTSIFRVLDDILHSDIFYHVMAFSQADEHSPITDQMAFAWLDHKDDLTALLQSFHDILKLENKLNAIQLNNGNMLTEYLGNIDGVKALFVKTNRHQLKVVPL